MQQPVAYNHKIHVTDLEIACDACHPGAIDGVVAGLPLLSNCADCHQDMQGKSAEERKVVAAVGAGQELPWIRLTPTWEDVFFSHRRHVVAAQIKCERCHGDMGKQVHPPPLALVSLTMDDCIECHEQRGADTDCVACHR